MKFYVQCPEISPTICVVDIPEEPTNTDRMRALLAATRATVWTEQEWDESEIGLSEEDKAMWPIKVVRRGTAQASGNEETT